MGGKPSKNNVESQSLTTKMPHQKFQNAQFLKDQGLIFITMLTGSSEQLTIWEQNCKKISKFADGTLLLPQKHQFQKTGFCTNSGILKLYFPNYPYVFTEQIKNRMSQQYYFIQKELWYLIFVLVTNAKLFSQLKRKIGDVRPQNILINDDGYIKTINSLSWPNQSTNYQKTLHNHIPTYLSPQEMKAIKQNNQFNPTDYIRSQSFSIGLTVLQCCLLFDFNQLYNTANFTFNETLLQRKIDELMQFNGGEKAKYSQSLKLVVKNMCEIDPATRKTSLQVQKLIQPHIESILQFKQFDLFPQQDYTPASSFVQPVPFTKTPGQLLKNNKNPTFPSFLATDPNKTEYNPNKTEYNPNRTNYVQTNYNSVIYNQPFPKYEPMSSSKYEAPSLAKYEQPYQPADSIYSPYQPTNNTELDNNDLLRKVERQLEESRKMFPDERLK